MGYRSQRVADLAAARGAGCDAGLKGRKQVPLAPYSLQTVCQSVKYAQNGLLSSLGCVNCRDLTA